MAGCLRTVGILIGSAFLGSAFLCGQNIPDAPQPKIQPPADNPFPDAPPAPKNNHPTQEAPSADTPGDGTSSAPVHSDQPTDGIATSRNDLPKFVSRVTFVEVPVTVKNSGGHMVPGLTDKDFTVYEDGVAQKLNFFSSDPFPLSVAVVVDTNLPASTMKKINETLPALVGAFSEFDEVALYRYGNSVAKVEDFTPSGGISTVSLERLKRTGNEGGVPVAGGPFGSVPSINGRPVEPGPTQQTYAPPQETNVLNDAILRAAQDLSRRERGVRRRIIFVISDGREYRSTAHYDEVKKFLLSQNIAVYGIGVDVKAIPIYDRLNRIRMPGFGYGDLLSKYALETGGDTFAEFNQNAIEQAYAKVTSEARNQYTLGYNTKSALASTYRSIDVHVHYPDLVVTAKTGYYSLPPAPQQPQTLAPRPQTQTPQPPTSGSQPH